MKKLTILLVILAFLFVPTGVLAAPAFGNVGPTTEFGYDISIIDELVAEGATADDYETIITFTDPTTEDRIITVPDSAQTIGTATTITDGLIIEADLNADNEPEDNDILTYDTTGANFSWDTPADLGLQTAITGSDTHVMFFDGANTPAGDADLTYNKGTDTLSATNFSGALTGNSTTTTTAAAGDAAVDFFGAGVDAVTDGDTCTDVEGTHLTITTSVLNVDDDFLLNDGDIGTGVYDFGGATSFEIPNKDADPAVTGQLILDTTVADMTNGNLAFYDGAAIRYVVSLAAADIWSDDDFVVAYDATGDKFYMKADADSGGFTGNFILHLMDIDAADAEYVIKDATGDADKIGDIIAMPDYGRNITTTGDGDGTGTITITGTLADGTTGQTDVIALAASATTQGVKAFTNITAIVSASTAGTFDVGIGDLIGLPNAISVEEDIYYKTVDGVAVFSEISGKANLANNTLDCGTIVQNEDITIYYHN